MANRFIYAYTALHQGNEYILRNDKGLIENSIQIKASENATSTYIIDIPIYYFQTGKQQVRKTGNGWSNSTWDGTTLYLGDIPLTYGDVTTQFPHTRYVLEDVYCNTMDNDGTEGGIHYSDPGDTGQITPPMSETAFLQKFGNLTNGNAQPNGQYPISSIKQYTDIVPVYTTNEYGLIEIGLTGTNDGPSLDELGFTPKIRLNGTLYPYVENVVKTEFDYPGQVTLKFETYRQGNPNPVYTNNGYRVGFVGWKNLVSGLNTNPYTFTPNNDVETAALYKLECHVNHTISQGGSISVEYVENAGGNHPQPLPSDGYVPYGWYLRITAIPDEGYRFVEWTGDISDRTGTYVEYRVEPRYPGPGEISFGAVFEEIPVVTYDVSVRSNGYGSATIQTYDGGWRTIAEGTGEIIGRNIDDGSSVRIVAEPNSGCYLVNATIANPQGATRWDVSESRYIIESITDNYDIQLEFSESPTPPTPTPTSSQFGSIIKLF